MNLLETGFFITFEGVEGGGKSSNLKLVQSLLTQKNIPFIVTREPGGTPLAEQIRTIVLAPREEKVDETTELLLIFAARAQHYKTNIKPALESGKWVLCDRFTDATYAYQGAGRGMNIATIALLEDLVQGEKRPDLTLLFDLDVEEGLARAKGRGALDRFEQQEFSFFERVRQLYLERAKTEDYYRIIDAGQSFENVQAQVKKQLNEFIELHREEG